MRKGLLSSFLVLLAGAGGAFGEASAAGGVARGPDPMPAWGTDDAHVSAWTSHGDGGGSTPCGWVSADYLLWWFKDGPIPFAFVLSGPNDNNNPGALNQRGFPVLTGREIEYGALSGVRVTAGGWLDSDGQLGLERSGFLLPQHCGSLPRFARVLSRSVRRQTSTLTCAFDGFCAESGRQDGY